MVESNIKPGCDSDEPDGRLNLTASAFNQLGQYIPAVLVTWVVLHRTCCFLP